MSFFPKSLGKSLKAVLCTLAEEKGFASVVPTFTLLLFCCAGGAAEHMGSHQVNFRGSRWLSMSSSAPGGRAGGLLLLCPTPLVTGDQLELSTSTGRSQNSLICSKPCWENPHILGKGLAL